MILDGPHLPSVPAMELQAPETAPGPSVPRAFVVHAIDSATALEFRKNFYDRQDWLSDGWDGNSVHYGYFVNGELAGVLRVVHPREGKLPLNDHLPEYPVQPGDCQIGRLLVAPQHRGGKILGFMLHHFSTELVHAGVRVILTPRETINLSPHRFQSLGFHLEQAGFDTAQGLVRNLWVRDNRPPPVPKVEDSPP